MNPAAIAAIIRYIQLALAAAPVIEQAVIDAKNLISQLFASKLITQEQQSLLHTHIDALAVVFKSGQELPSHWQVQPDPA
jgi:hypothetical protein